MTLASLRSRQRLKGAPAGESPNCLSPEAYLGAAQALALDAIRERKAAVLAPRARGSSFAAGAATVRALLGRGRNAGGTLGFHQSATFLPSVNRVRSYSGEHARARSGSVICPRLGYAQRFVSGESSCERAPAQAPPNP
jgi:hypothetical protein